MQRSLIGLIDPTDFQTDNDGTIAEVMRLENLKVVRVGHDEIKLHTNVSPRAS